MKKSILSIVMLLVVATATNAAPRFGIIGEQEGGVGAFITDDMYNAQVTVGNSSNDDSAETKMTAIKVGANYKIALDSVTALTFGANYQTTTGDVSGKEIDKLNTIAISAGFERGLSKNLVLTTQADVYSQKTDNATVAAETKTTKIFSNGRVGVAYLF